MDRSNSHLFFGEPQVILFRIPFHETHEPARTREMKVKGKPVSTILHQCGSWRHAAAEWTAAELYNMLVFRTNLSHSKPLRMTYFASMRSGLPLRNFACTSTVDRVPSSSTRYSPVISPRSEEASNTDGALNTKDAVPEDPSRALVNRTSGTVGSFTPLMNCIDEAIDSIVALAEARHHLSELLLCCLTCWAESRPAAHRSYHL